MCNRFTENVTKRPGWNHETAIGWRSNNNNFNEPNFSAINTIFFKNIGTYCTFLRALWEHSSLVCHWQFNLLWASDCHNGQKNDHKDNLLQMSMGSNIQLSLFFLFLKLLMVLLLFEANTESDPPLLHIFWKKSNTKCKTSYKNIF